MTTKTVKIKGRDYNSGMANSPQRDCRSLYGGFTELLGPRRVYTVERRPALWMRSIRSLVFEGLSVAKAYGTIQVCSECEMRGLDPCKPFVVYSDTSLLKYGR